MREFEHRRNFRKILSSPLVILPMVVVFLILVRATWRMYERSRESGLELRLAEERLTRIQDRQEKLKSSIDKLQTESGIEGEIRDRFQMAKEDETEVVIVEAPIPPTSSEPLKIGFLQKVLNFFTR